MLPPKENLDLKSDFLSLLGVNVGSSKMPWKCDMAYSNFIVSDLVVSFA